MPAATDQRDVVAASRTTTVLLLGNTAVVEKFRERGAALRKRKRPDLRNQVTEVHFPEGTNLVDAVKNVSDLWPWHSDADGPEWVQCDDPILERAVSEHFTRDGHECVIGRPDGWNEG